MQRSLDFYREAIDDRMDSGLTEQEAVADLGSPEEISNQILAETPLPKLIRAKVTPSRTLKAWDIVLLVRGFGNLLYTGSGLAMMGLSVLLFFAANVAAKGILALSKHYVLKIKSMLKRLEEVHEKHKENRDLRRDSACGGGGVFDSDGNGHGKGKLEGAESRGI